MTTYNAEGLRVPFNPVRTGAELAGCLLCGRPGVLVGVFVPQDSAMQAAVLRLRKRPVRPRTTSGLLYALCQRHADNADTVVEQVEQAIRAAAKRVQVQ